MSPYSIDNQEMPERCFFYLNAFKFQGFNQNSKLWTIRKICLKFKKMFSLDCLGSCGSMKNSEQTFALYQLIQLLWFFFPAHHLLKCDCFTSRWDFLALPRWQENDTDFFAFWTKKRSGNESNGLERCIGPLLTLLLLKYTLLIIFPVGFKVRVLSFSYPHWPYPKRQIEFIWLKSLETGTCRKPCESLLCVKYHIQATKRRSFIVKV